ncbi:MAG: sigma-70 family RNA polymerase sigma factor [Clostridia bacterium]|nr:sigma-70 family RNA polymerase sigma factor [Clostridia bacterium]
MDRHEFAARVVERTDRMYRIAWTVLRNSEDCRDAMQGAAMKAWEKRHTLRDERYFDTWLTRILLNECYRIQRKQRRSVPLEEMAEPAILPKDMTLSLALQNLPEKLRLPLVMHALEGMSYEEIARALHISKSTVTGRIQRARQQLRKELEE